jgi:TonB family protein
MQSKYSQAARDTGEDTVRLGTTLGIAMVMSVAGHFSPEAKTPARFDTAAQTSVVSSYPETADGLKSFLQDLFSSMNTGDENKSADLLASLAIPNHGAWFLSKFGPSEGPRLESKYSDHQVKSVDLLKKRLEQAIQDGRAQIDIVPVQKPEDTSIRLIKAVLEAVVQPTTIYMATDSKVPEVKSPFYLGEFVYVDGGFRFVDRAVFQALSTAPPMRVSIGGNVQRARLVKEVAPEYPAEALANKITGTVSLKVVIGTDGKVLEIQVVSGHPLLAQAALNAVRQWVYQPTLLNGNPVEVLTVVNVTFQH